MWTLIKILLIPLYYYLLHCSLHCLVLTRYITQCYNRWYRLLIIIHYILIYNSLSYYCEYSLFVVRCEADPRTDATTAPKGLLTHSVASTIRRLTPLYSQGKEAPSHALKPISGASLKGWLRTWHLSCHLLSLLLSLLLPLSLSSSRSMSFLFSWTIYSARGHAF